VNEARFRVAGQPRQLAFDPRVPNVARIYDALLDGKPAPSNVHEIAQSYDPAARVVYADCDPVVVLHANALLTDAPDVAVINGDLRYPRDLLAAPGVRALIDFDEPVAVLLAAVLHFLEDRDGPWGAVECITERMAPGSYLVISHATGDGIGPDAARRAREVYKKASAPAVPRSRDEIERFFDGLVMVAPGLVPAGDWRPDQLARTSHETLVCAGIGRKTTSDDCPGRRR
jgi:hypothetical protein